MRLFYQLTESEQNDALHHCANIVMDDMINEGVKLDPITQEEMDLKDKLEDAVDCIQSIPDREGKVNYLMSDAIVSKAIYDIALEMAKSAFYHDESELIIFPTAIKEKEENLLPAPQPTKPKKPSPLN